MCLIYAMKMRSMQDPYETFIYYDDNDIQVDIDSLMWFSWCIWHLNLIFWNMSQYIGGGINNKYKVMSSSHTIKNSGVCSFLLMFCKIWVSARFCGFVLRGVHVLVICVQILVRLDCFSHSITMEVWKPARWKTAKINRNKHTPAVFHTLTLKLPIQTSLSVCQTPSLYTFRWKMWKFQQNKHTPGNREKRPRNHLNSVFLFFHWLRDLGYFVAEKNFIQDAQIWVQIHLQCWHIFLHTW